MCRAMKTFTLLLLTLGWSCQTGFSQEANTNLPVKIQAAEAKKHIGAEVVVSGKVVEVNKAEKLVRLNLDKAYPDQPFTAVVFATKTNLFPELDKLKNKTIEVTGKITEFHDRPQIVLVSTNQLKVVEKPTESEKK